MKAKIFYDLWEMECCGTPFKIGEGVDWLVRNIDGIKDTIEVDNLDYIYDAHNDDWENIYKLKGIVKTINIYYEKFEIKVVEGRNMLVPIPKTSKIVNTNSSDDYDEEMDGLKASAYVVELEDVTIRPATEKEVTYH